MKAELLKHPVCQEITNQNIRFVLSAMQALRNDCTIVNNRISFVFDSETIGISYLLLDSTPIACMDRCCNLVRQRFV